MGDLVIGDRDTVKFRHTQRWQKPTNQTRQPKSRKIFQRQNSVLRRKLLYHLSAWDKQMASCVIFCSL